jgi:hypothetical protein
LDLSVNIAQEEFNEIADNLATVAEHVELISRRDAQGVFARIHLMEKQHH